MREVGMRLVVVATLCVMAVAAWAQPGAEEMQRTAEEYEEWMAAMAEHIADVRFDEGDVQDFLSYWEGFADLDDLGTEDDEDWERFKDLDWILGNPAYRAWVAEHGLDAKDWLLKSMRIQMMLMREQMAQSSAMMDEQMPQQMAMIEEQCKSVGPEMCEQMKAAMAASMAMYEGMSRGFDKLPEPTPPEAAALDAHRDELTMLLMGDEEEEDW